MEKASIEIDSRFLDCKDLARRTSIFLDSNVWINLSQRRTAEWTEAVEILTHLVRAGRAFCPLYSAVIWELYKQAPEQARLRARLMDDLSLKTSFERGAYIFRKEVRNFFFSFFDRRRYSLEVADLLVPLSSYNCSSYEVSFPESCLPEIRDFTLSQAPSKVASVGLTDFLEFHIRTGQRWEVDMEGVPAKYDMARRNRRNVAGKSKSKAWKIEAQHVFEAYVFPELDNLLRWRMDSGGIRFTEYVDALKSDREGCRFNSVLKHTPALRNYIDIQTVAFLDPLREFRSNDFFDIEMMAVPLAYADVFFAEDRWMREMTKQESRLRKGRSVIWSVREFLELLEKLAS